MADYEYAVVLGGKVIAVFRDAPSAYRLAERVAAEGESPLGLVQRAPAFMSWSTVGEMGSDGEGV